MKPKILLLVGALALLTVLPAALAGPPVESSACSFTDAPKAVPVPVAPIMTPIILYAAVPKPIIPIMLSAVPAVVPTPPLARSSAVVAPRAVSLLPLEGWRFALPLRLVANASPPRALLVFCWRPR